MPTTVKAKSSPWQLAKASGPALFAWRRSVGLNRATFAGLANFSERSLATYEKHKHLPKIARPQVTEAVRLVKALQELVPAQDLSEWLRTPNSGFDGRKPWSLIRSGERDVIWSMIHQTQQAAFA